MQREQAAERSEQRGAGERRGREIPVGDDDQQRHLQEEQRLRQQRPLEDEQARVQPREHGGEQPDARRRQAPPGEPDGHNGRDTDERGEHLRPERRGEAEQGGNGQHHRPRRRVERRRRQVERIEERVAMAKERRGALVVDAVGMREVVTQPDRVREAQSQRAGRDQREAPEEAFVGVPSAHARSSVGDGLGR